MWDLPGMAARTSLSFFWPISTDPSVLSLGMVSLGKPFQICQVKLVVGGTGFFVTVTSRKRGYTDPFCER